MKIPEPVLEAVQNHHKRSSKEQLSFLFARQVRRGKRTIVLVAPEEPLLLDDDCFVRQHRAGVTLDTEVQGAVLRRFAESGCSVLINIHDHPFSTAGTQFSGIDDRDDLVQDRSLRTLPWDVFGEQYADLGKRIVNLSIVLDQTTLAARIVDHRRRRCPFLPVDRVLVIGRQLRVLRPNNASVPEPSGHRQPEDLFHRQGDFVSAEQQRTMGGLTAVLVGCGGTGSVLGEGLVRLGFRRLILVDDDKVEATNLNRLQGGEIADIGRPKVDVLGERLRRAMPGVEILTCGNGLYHPDTLKCLAEGDLLIGAVDNHPARYVLNRIASQYLMPYLDSGVVVQMQAQQVDFLQRLFVSLPGVTSCMECTQFQLLDPEAVGEAMHDPLTYEALRAHGYIHGVAAEGSAPSVYPLNLANAAVLLQELLNLVCGFRPRTTVLSDSYQSGERQRADQSLFDERAHPDCPNCGFYQALGDSEPVAVPRKYRKEPPLQFDPEACIPVDAGEAPVDVGE